MRRLVAGAALVAVAALALSACGGSSDAEKDSSSSAQPSASASASPSASAAPSSSSASPMVITIKSYKYSGPDSIPPGAKVTIKNDDPVAHTVTSDQDGMFDVKVDAKATATLTAPSKPGSYSYHCTYHGNMQGKLTVG